jgi:uncharacterized membrane protein YqjE
MTQNVSNFACDLVTLAELQAKLLAADFRESKRRLVWPLVLLPVSLVMLLACFPILLIGTAYLFQKWLSVTASYFAAAGVGALLAIVLGYAGWRLLVSSIQLYRRSLNELDRNVQWLKMVLTSR